MIANSYGSIACFQSSGLALANLVGSQCLRLTRGGKIVDFSLDYLEAVGLHSDRRVYRPDTPNFNQFCILIVLRDPYNNENHLLFKII